MSFSQIYLSFFQTTEFYVLLFLAAMAIVAFLAMPHTSGAVSEYLLGAAIETDSDGDNPSPMISIDCDDKGTAWLRRTGLEGIGPSGAVSAKIVVKGFNITVYERLTPGRSNDNGIEIVGAPVEIPPTETAIFQLDFLASERYYLRYESDATNRTATLAFRNTPGYHAQADLKQ